MKDRKTKLFISYASEDKESFVDQLYEALKEVFYVWYAECSLTVGDKLHNKISEGLRECDYGVVVLSDAFFSKKWPQSELDGLLSLEDENRKIILPVWHNVDVDQVKKFSPILAGRLGIESSAGIPKIVNEIIRSTQVGNKTSSIRSPSARVRLSRLDEQLLSDERNSALAKSKEGHVIIRKGAVETIGRVRSELLKAAQSISRIRIELKDEEDGHDRCFVVFSADYGLEFCIDYHVMLGDAEIRGGVWKPEKPKVWYEEVKQINLFKIDVFPFFVGKQELVWKNKEQEFTSTGLADHLIDAFIGEIEKAHEGESR